MKFLPFAELIKFVENRQYDHVYIRIQEPSNNTWMIFQASGIAVNLMSAQNFFSVNKAIKEYEISLPDDVIDRLWGFINDNLGIRYSLIEDFGILLMKIFHLKNQPFNQGMSAEFCSKLGANVCILCGIDIKEDVSKIDPTALDDILLNAGLRCLNNPIFKN